MREFFTGVVKDTIEYREKNKVVRNDFLQLLMELKNKGYIEGDGVDIKPGKDIPGMMNFQLFQSKLFPPLLFELSEEEKFTITKATAQAFVFFVAGFETSSTTMQFALYELSKKQEVQDKLRQEIRRVLKNHNGQITYEGVQELEYLDWVVAG